MIGPGRPGRAGVPKVEQAGYRPKLMTVQFRPRKIGNLLILVPAIANIFFAWVISGAQQALQTTGY